jgi:hypothetical protein
MEARLQIAQLVWQVTKTSVISSRLADEIVALHLFSDEITNLSCLSPLFPPMSTKSLRRVHCNLSH